MHLFLSFSNFNDVFVISCDAYGVGIGRVLIYKENSIKFFSEKLNETKQQYSNYDVKLYAVVQALSYQKYYVLPKMCVILQSSILKYLSSQMKLEQGYTIQIEFLQKYFFPNKFCLNKNEHVDTLSRVLILLCAIKVKVLGFDYIKKNISLIRFQ